MFGNVTLCRLCIAEGTETLPIYDYDSESSSTPSFLQMVITILANVQVYPGDGLPNAVCCNCRRMLHDYHEFKLMVERSDMILRDKLKESEVDPLSDVADVTLKPNVENTEFKCELQLDEEDNLIEKEGGANEHAIIPQDSLEEFDKKFIICEVPNSLSFEDRDNIERVEEMNVNTNKLITPQGSSTITVENSLDLLCKQEEDNLSLKEDCNNEHAIALQDSLEEFDEKHAVSEASNSLSFQDEDIIERVEKINVWNNNTITPQGNTATSVGNSVDLQCMQVTNETQIEEPEQQNTNDRENLERVKHCDPISQLASRCCYLCSKIMEDEIILKEHLEEEHSYIFTIQCSECNDRFKSNTDLNKHIYKMHAFCELEQKYKCCTCNTVFKNRLSYVKHRSRKHSGKVEVISCDICGKRYSSKGILSRHVKTQHPSTKETAKEYPCEKCKRNYRNEFALYQHTQYDGCDGSKTVNCDKCNKTFKNSIILKTHKKYVHTDFVHICDICGKETKFLYKHMKRYHSNEPNDCSICNTSFSNINELEKHKRNEHYKSKNFVCEKCGKKFKAKKTLSNHMFTHTGEKNYKCNICEQRFRQKAQLTTHSRIHTGAEPYQCENCGLSFRWKGTFDKHKNKCSENSD